MSLTRAFKPFREAWQEFRWLIRGAVYLKGGKIHPYEGLLTPAEFGCATLWQMKHLYGFGPEFKAFPHDPKAAYFLASRLRGVSEYEAWRKWEDELKPAYERAAREAKGGR